MTQASGPLLWINAGEVSGDLHGASLLEGFHELAAEGRPMVRARGMGGEFMTAAGMRPDFDSKAIGLVGFTEVFASLPTILGLLWRTRRMLKQTRPAAVVLIDCPDYNFLVARMTRGLGIPTYYYISPQVWAWRKGRVKFLKKYCRAVLCILPFEEEFYWSHGVKARFIGHPLLDQMPLDDLLQQPHERGLVGILPGSRRREIDVLLPEMAEAARILLERDPRLRFALFPAPGRDAEALRARLPEDMPVTIVPPEQRYAGMRRCQVLLAASGTVTLEAALVGAPTVVAYQLSKLTFALARRIIKVPYISLPNLILHEAAFPELLQDQATAKPMAEAAWRWLSNPGAEAATRGALARLREKMGPPGAARRAAAAILDDLRELGVLDEQGGTKA